MTVWIPKAVITAIHAELLREHGGLNGAVNEGTLESTMARPQNLVAYKKPNKPTIFELAASYGFGFARNHCFSDGNKHIALVAIDVFLQINGYELIAEEVAAVDMIKSLSSGDVKEEQLNVWIQAHAKKYKPD